MGEAGIALVAGDRERGPRVCQKAVDRVGEWSV
jgi:hypothetical protein